MSTSPPINDEANASKLAETNAKLLNALFGQYGIASGLQVLEKNLATAVKADPQDAPFPLVGEAAILWHRATAEAYRHALEMVCLSKEVLDLAPATAALDKSGAGAATDA